MSLSLSLTKKLKTKCTVRKEKVMWSGGHLPESGVIYTVKELSEKCQDPGVMQGESVRVNGSTEIQHGRLLADTL